MLEAVSRTVSHIVLAWADGHLTVFWPFRQVFQIESKVVLRTCEMP
jgi:hypothetical protein